MIKFNDLDELQKFLFNRVDKDMFAEYLEADINHIPSEGYIDEKWKLFNKNQILFITSHASENFLKALYRGMNL